MGLAGKSVLITRTAEQAGAMAEAIRSRGGRPILFPTIDVTPPPSWESCDRAIDALQTYDGILFTSGNAVGFFLRRIADRGHSNAELESKRLYAVGRATRDRLAREGLQVAVVPGHFTAADLARAMQNEDLKGKSLLFPCGNLADPSLTAEVRALGAKVDAVVVYETKKPAVAEVDKIRSLLLKGGIDILTFTSPSTWRNFISLFPEENIRKTIQSAAIAAIGPVTGREIEASGFTVTLIAAESTVEAFVDAIDRNMQKIHP